MFSKHLPMRAIFSIASVLSAALLGAAPSCAAQTASAKPAAATEAEPPSPAPVLKMGEVRPSPLAPSREVNPADPYGILRSGPPAPTGGRQEGVKIHGHWVIDVRNPDGTLAQHHDFENSATGYGQELLAALMSGYAVPSDYAIFLASTGTAPCSAPQGNIGCGIVHSLTTLPGSALCQYYTCFTSLTYAANIIDSSASGSTFTLAGNFTASQAGTITGVSTFYGTCPANLSTVTGLTTVSPSTCSTTPGSGGYRTGTTTTITTVNVVASQIVQVTVTFSFS